jgi:hypothetical protein
VPESSLGKGALQDFERKRGRAMRHFEDLRESVEAFTGRRRDSVRGAFDAETRQYTFEVPLERHPPDWTLHLGDYAYNARASLDYLITALVRSSGGSEHRTSEFPIYGFDRVGWAKIDEWWENDPDRRIRRQLRGTPDGTKAALKHLQPFYGAPQVDPMRHPLLHLRELSNRDKHRRLNLLVRRASMKFVDASGGPIYEGPDPTARIADPREGDFYTVSLSVREEVDQEVFILPTYDLALNEPPELIGSLIQTLVKINDCIDSRVLPVVRGLL